MQEDVRRALLERLIDHAALFPPASMSMEEALAEDRAARTSPYAWMLDRFVCPASKLGSLDALDAPVSVVLDADLEAPAEAIEVRPRDTRDLAATVSRLRELSPEVYVELPPDALPDAIDSIASAGGRAKLRCGGDVVPSVDQVAHVVVACSEAGVVMKATAGLHHPLRRGGEHGFLNLLFGAMYAHHGIHVVRDLLEHESFDALPLDELSSSAVRSARKTLFKGFGSCSWREPVDDLRALGVLS
ncbi:MAG TPA: hypothetical protein VG126_01185 [Thermoleophilaceae bacterium]|nr:hypothetical protein [Thermoleophilaceae bacterium]